MSVVESNTQLERFVARQPIFDRALKVHAYELLFRSSPLNRCTEPDADKATCSMIGDGSVVHDLRRLTGGRPAWINVTREAILEGHVRLLPPEGVVLELLESITPDDTLVEACRELRHDGYELALDDFVYDPSWEPLFELASVVKVDFLGEDPEAPAELAARFRGTRMRLLAEKVETHDAVQTARKLGYTLFQGFFFAKPLVMSARDIPAGRVQLANILQELTRSEVDFDRVEEVIRQDVALCYRLLRYINAACRGFRYPVSSIRRGIILLGIKEIQRWATLSVMTMAAQDRMPERIVQGLIRARFCESLAEIAGLRQRRDDLFLIGLLSIIDAVLERPMQEVIEPLPLADDVKAALLGEHNPLRELLELSLTYERGSWDRVALADIGGDEADIAECYIDAVEWSSSLNP